MVAKISMLLFLCFVYMTSEVKSASQYTVMTQEVSYFDAGLTCKQAGMDLLSIETLDEWQEIVQLLESLGYGNGTKLTFSLWTSANSLNEPHSRNFFWTSDGSLIPRDGLFWGPDQPDDANTTTSYDEQCVNVQNFNGNFGINDLNCNFESGFICERNCQDDALSILAPSDRYEVVSQNVSYFDAALTCEQSGKDLVSVETLDEWQVIVGLLKQLGYDSEDGYLFWTSGNSLNDPHSRNFYWMSDGSLVPRDVLFWGKTQPDDASNDVNYDEECVDIQHFDGAFGLNDYNCHFEHGFICEDRIEC